MVIQCESCRTVFSLDDALLKEGGSKVRCSLCRNIFTAYPPPRFLDEMAAETPIDRGGVEAETVDESISIFDEKDEDFEADLDGVYEEVFKEPVGALEEKKEEPPKGVEDIMEDGVEEKQGGSADGLACDFLPMEDVYDGSEEDERAAETVREAPARKKSSKWGFFVVILLALLVAAAAITYWRPELIPPSISFLKPPEKKKPVDAGVRLLQFKSVTGSFVNYEKAGQLFVIRGMVSSEYPRPRSHILIRGSVLDNKGKVVETSLSYAGNTFTEEEIKALPLEDIKKAMQNRDGMARQNFNISSGVTIPFMVVFDKLNDNLSEFTVEAVSSSPGT
ncbi:MAG: zinc-ribbon domain-containing protein [Proteobacteria bacterium]|nr:zinc-ribbon domain-containing protein [Pseudomonadota bacterium]